MVSIILMIIAGIFNAVMDVLKTRFDKSIFQDWKAQQWINPSLSWVNKWRFESKAMDFLMSTVFVWLTDLWHFAKMMMLMCIAFAVVFYSPILTWWADVLIMYCAFTMPFELFYSQIFIRKYL